MQYFLKIFWCWCHPCFYATCAFFRHLKKQNNSVPQNLFIRLVLQSEQKPKFFIYIILLTNNNKNLLIFHMYLAPSKSLWCWLWLSFRFWALNRLQKSPNGAPRLSLPRRPPPPKPVGHQKRLLSILTSSTCPLPVQSSSSGASTWEAVTSQTGSQARPVTISVL